MKHAVSIILGAALLAMSAPVHADEGKDKDAPVGASSYNVVTRTAVVEKIDPETRRVVLRDEQGSVFAVTAGPEVTRFDEIEPGDTVRLSYEQAISINLTDRGLDEGVKVAAGAAETTADAKPGRGMARAINFVVEFISFDPRTGVVTFVRPDGDLAAMVAQPDAHEFAKERKSGDRIEVTIEQAVALTIDEI